MRALHSPRPRPALVPLAALLLLPALAPTASAQPPIVYATPFQVLEAPVGTPCPSSADGPTLSVSGDTLAAVWGVATRPNRGCETVDVYRRDGTRWVLEQRLDLGQFNDGRSVASVAVSAETLAVGTTTGADEYGASRGAVHVYGRQNGLWTRESTILAPTVGNQVDAYAFGHTLALDGDTLLVGDPGRTTRLPYENPHDHWYAPTGAVFFYARREGQWQVEQQVGPAAAYFVPATGLYRFFRPWAIRFGHAVALDGSRALVDGPWTSFETQSKTVSAFTRGVDGWAVQTSTATTFGSSFDGGVAVRGDLGVAGGLGQVLQFKNDAWSASALPNGTSLQCGTEATISAAAIAGDGPDGRLPVALSCGFVLLDEFPIGQSPGKAVLLRRAGQEGATDSFGGSLAFAGRTLAVNDGSKVYLFDVDDLDADGLPTDWEMAQGLSPWSAAGPDGATGDPDGDGVTNAAERAAGTFARIPNTWLFAEGATGFFDTRVALVNAEAVTATTTVRLLFEDGTSESKTLTIEGGHRDTVDVSTWLAGRAVPFSIEVVSSPDAVVAERTMAWPAATRASAHTGAGVPAARTSWYFAEGDARAFDTYLLVANPQASPVTVTATFLLDDGTTFSRGYDVGARARLTLYLDAVEGLRGHSFATTLVGSAAVVAERAMYLDAVGERWKIGHVAAGAAAPATAWYVAEGTTRAPFDEYLLLANPGEATRATVTFLLPQGAPVVVPYDLAAHSRTTIAVNDVPGVAETDVSIAVAADHPIVVERAMYWPRAYPAWYEGHVVGGVTAAGTRWVLAEGESGGAAGVESYVLVANPSASDAHLRVRVLRTGDHAPIVFERVVASQTRLTLAMSEVGLEAGETFGVDVESLDGTPIVVERAMYWNAAGRTWSAGTAEAGLRLR